MTRRTHASPVPAAVAAAALAAFLVAAPAGAEDMVLDGNGQLKLPPDHAAMTTMAAKGHAALADVAKGIMPHAAAPKGTGPAPAMPDGAGMEEGTPEDPLAADAESHGAEPGPMYTARNLRDPFSLPAEVRAPEARREDVPPLERMPLSDFKLVAVVKKRGSNVAMVASSDGKGYTLGVGTRIGSDGGEVRRIMPDAVIVEQVRADEFGELKKSEIVLGLRPEEVVP
jgi:hypothetical protein